MFEAAMAGNVTLLIWLSKNMLGYTDKVDTKLEAGEAGLIMTVRDYTSTV